MASRVLVLGGAGFIGSNVVSALLSAGHSVTVLDGLVHHTGANLKFIRPHRKALTFLKTEIGRAKGLDKVFREHDVVVDSMGLTAHHFGMEHPHIDMRCNLESHIVAMEALHASKFKGLLVYLGSKSQYGTCPDDPITESSAPLPKDVQSVHKQAAEQHYQTFAKRDGWRFVSLRVPNCFGPNQPFGRLDIGLIAEFILKALRGEEITVFEGAQRKRDILFAPDLAAVVAAIVGLPESAQAPGCYNVSGYYLPIKELAEKIVAIAGSGSVRYESMPPNVRLVNLDAAAYDLKKLKALLPALRITPLPEALKQTIDYSRKACNTSGAAT
jgi:UDP-glucose 4-epimerase